jgi:hypothetical protein
VMGPFVERPEKDFEILGVIGDNQYMLAGH